ncbi:MAG: methyltransferase domain-containing protein [bacterium]|jgi:SAM-dependent methyltransferase
MKTFPHDYHVVEGVWHPFVEDPIPYSDGDEAERYLEETFANTSDLSSDSPTLALAIKDWPSQYHLSPQRANLLRPLEIPRYARVLELGCGCGAVTRFLGQNAGHVVAVEGSPVRARLAKMRCGDLANVDIVAGNFDDIRMTAPFEIVTLVGVLEYAGIFWRQPGDPFEGMLRFAWENLAPNGVLIIAIENKLGMKYFSGCTEDHLSRRFPGIEGYPDNDGPRTFGRAELIEIASRCGFADFELLLPFPDYKIPSTLINGRFTSAEDCRKYNLVDWCRDPFRDYVNEREHLFNDQLALASAAKSGLMADFSNSFLLIAAKEPFGEGSAIRRPAWIAKKFNMLRRPEYRTITTLLEKDGGPVIAKERANGLLPEPSLPVRLSVAAERAYIGGGKSLSQEMLRAIRRNTGGEKEFQGFVAGWVHYLRSRVMPGTNLLPPSHVDCQPGNLILDSTGALHYIDDEWHWHERVSMDWVLFRGLFVFWLECRLWIERSPLRQHARFADFLSLSLEPTGTAIGEERVEELIALEIAFHETVSPFPPVAYRDLLRRSCGETVPPGNPRPSGAEVGLVAKVEELFQSGDVVRALSLAGDIAETYPKNAANWNNIGVILTHLGRQNQAKDCLRIALALDDRFAEARNNLEAIEGVPCGPVMNAAPAESVSDATAGRNTVKSNRQPKKHMEKYPRRLVMTLLVRDEADIVRNNILFHLNSGVDHIVVTDNNSCDGTVEILEEFVREGVVDLIHQPEHGYHQGRWVTSMAAFARDKLGADWIINADADEFWNAQAGDLKSLIAGKNGNVLFANRRNMLPSFSTNDSSNPLTSNLLAVIRSLRSKEQMLTLLDCGSPKAFFSASGMREVLQGNHNVIIDGERREEYCPELCIFHYPIRSFNHFERKVANGGAAYANSPDLPSNLGSHWRHWYELQRSGKLKEVYDEIVIPEKRREELSRVGLLAVDLRLAELVSNEFVRLGDSQNEHIYQKPFYEMHIPWQEEYNAVADAIAGVIPFGTVIDLGCGNGFLLARLATHGKKVAGVEVTSEGVLAAKQSVPGPVRVGDLRFPLYLGRRDVAICTEVAEHLEKEYADVLIDNIVRHAKEWVIFTGATEEQTGGEHHVNLQPHSYWIEKFEQRGFVKDVNRSLALKEHMSPHTERIIWFPKNAMIFHRVGI